MWCKKVNIYISKLVKSLKRGPARGHPIDGRKAGVHQMWSCQGRVGRAGRGRQGRPAMPARGARGTKGVGGSLVGTRVRHCGRGEEPSMTFLKGAVISYNIQGLIAGLKREDVSWSFRGELSPRGEVSIRVECC